jgi:hypothetical protein
MSNSGSFATMSFVIPSFLLEDGTFSSASAVTQSFLDFRDSGYYEHDNTVLGQLPITPYPYEQHLPTGYTDNGVLTGYTGTTFLAVGGSRIEEKRKYGSTEYVGVTTGTTNEGLKYKDYTFTYVGETMGTQNLYYRDYEDGYTMITGNTSGFTKETIYDSILTRNEHFLGFVEQPTVYSDVFVERGKQGVMEVNLRLGEVDNMGELSVYSGGYFKVKKQ